MRFDDRLHTVLSQQPVYAHDRAVRWRQLVELLARGGHIQTELVGQAYSEVANEAGMIDEQLRAATARAVAGPQLPAELVALFARDTVAVAAPVLTAAKLSPEEWSRVIEGASPTSRRLLRSLHPQLQGQPDARRTAEATGQTGQAASTAPDSSHHVPSISEVVARIERLRHEREEFGERPSAAADEMAAPEASSLFRWECGPTGEISWVEGVPRGPLIGRSIAQPLELSGVNEKARRAFASRAPFSDAALSIPGEGTVAGEWRISGVPAFEPIDGRFAGYRGIATRAGQPQAAERPRPPVPMDHDTLRELVHELKTPLNAIIGFAEIIDGQYLGPAEESYRKRAAEIAVQARLLLAAIEDLDLAARLRSAPEKAAGSSDLREIVAQASVELVDLAGQRGSSLVIELAAQPVPSSVEEDLARRIVRRFCSSIIETAAAGERLGLSLNADEQGCRLSLDMPQAMQAGTPTADTAAGTAVPASVSLRLAKALARVAGGDLIEEAQQAVLLFPSAA